MTEKAIVNGIVKALQLKGFFVATEVPNLYRSADIAVIDNDNNIWIIECKISKISKAIEQIKTHKLSADKVFIGTPLRKTKKETLKNIKEAEIGLIYLMPDGSIDIVFENFFNKPYKPVREKLLKRIQGNSVMATHIYHYNTHSEKRFFLGREHHGFYDMICLNGNIVSHTPSGVAAFVSTTAKKFFIDPQTHAFQHSTINLKRIIDDEYKFKPSIEKLAEVRLKGVFPIVIHEDRPLAPKDFLNDKGEINYDVIEETCINVINFQLNTLMNELDSETKEFMNEDYFDFKPDFVIAPYFYLTKHSFLDWLSINIECYKKSKEILPFEIPLFLSLVLSKEIVYGNESKKVIEEISKINPDGILLWIDEHIEENLYEYEIDKFIEFVKTLKKETGTIYNSHGGYLSTLLCHSDIDSIINGVGHSINYGEQRSVIPVGGGIPMARFYFPSIHSRLRFGDALDIVLKNRWLDSKDIYKNNVCSCAQCKKLINNYDSIDDAFLAYGESKPVSFTRSTGSIVRLEYPTKEAKEAASRHYLYVKTKEFRDLEKKSLKEICINIRDTFNKIAPYSEEILIGHLYNWQVSLLKNLK